MRTKNQPRWGERELSIALTGLRAIFIRNPGLTSGAIFHSPDRAENQNIINAGINS